MESFGFAIPVGRQIDYDNNDQTLYHYLKKHEPSIQLCIGCGGCTATCTSGNFTNFNFRKLHMLLSRGEAINIEQEISKCMLCGKCKLVCPRGVNTRNIIFTLKQWIKENRSSSKINSN